MKRLLTPLSLLVALAALLSACVNHSKILANGLDIEVTAIERSSDGAVAVSWHVKNSNIVSYLISRVNHKIQLNGTSLGTIDEVEALAVPANSNAGRTSKLARVGAVAEQALIEAAKTGTASYHVDSQVTILIYDDTVEKSVLNHSGTVAVTTK